MSKKNEALPGQPIPRFIGDLAFEPDFTKIGDILEFMGGVSNAYVRGLIPETETARTLLDAAYKAGTLLVKHEAVGQETDAIAEIVREMAASAAVKELQ